ncbi:MAG: hypothetical protein JEZ09_11140 [Salinivirgaceae bacterium]|nr:hypothetical protein [Salinivirgaceae bacterium]
MRKLLLIIFGVISINMVFAQKPLTFIEVDTTTYQAYLISDWDKIIDVGNRAIDNNIDYYFLRLRIAYAWFKKNRYALAIPHYEKAIELNNNSAIILAYLYNCYQYTGRKNDAVKLANKYPEVLNEYFNKKINKKFTRVDFNTTQAFASNSNLQEEIIETAPTTIDGTQKLLNSYINYHLNIGHRIGKSIIVSHSTNLLYKNEFAYTLFNLYPYISEAQIIRQINYTIKVDITPTEGLTISPIVSYLNYRIPIFLEYGTGSGKNREVYQYNSFNEIALGIIASKYIKFFKFSMAASHAEFNSGKQNTLAGSIAVYPLSNLNLYYNLNGYLHMQHQGVESIKQFIQRHELGVKILPNLWMEGYVMAGEFNNFYDPFSTITYNSIEKYNSILGLNIIVPFYKINLTLFAAYKIYHSKSIFSPFKNTFETYNSKNISYQSFTGGLSWKF